MLNAERNHQIAVLIDPEKMVADLMHIEQWCLFIQKAKIDFILVGGSTVSNEQMHQVCQQIQRFSNTPLLLFPGSTEQICTFADGILLLNLISGNNPDYLIGQHIQAADLLWNSNLQIFSTSYVLIDGGSETSVQRISKTKAIDPTKIEYIQKVLKAGRLIGHKYCYLEAGSGALSSVPSEIIKNAKLIFDYVIVGGGIKTVSEIAEKHNAGANLVVIGNHLESNPQFFSEIQLYKENLLSETYK